MQLQIKEEGLRNSIFFMVESHYQFLLVPKPIASFTLKGQQIIFNEQTVGLFVPIIRKQKSIEL